MNPNLTRLHPYPFEKLARLKAGITVPEHLPAISLGIGEPKHPSPAFVKQVIADHLDRLANYPTTASNSNQEPSVPSAMWYRSMAPGKPFLRWCRR
jgi:N-succinyldiaminopimelate aminotransferase